MRQLVTFIVRLWIDPQREELSPEGRIECVTGGIRAHVHSLDEVADFIETHLGFKPDDSTVELENERQD